MKLKAWKSEAYGAKLKSYVVQHSALDSIYIYGEPAPRKVSAGVHAVV